jgi:hypothetical protein
VVFDCSACLANGVIHRKIGELGDEALQRSFWYIVYIFLEQFIAQIEMFVFLGTLVHTCVVLFN